MRASPVLFRISVAQHPVDQTRYVCSRKTRRVRRHRSLVRDFSPVSLATLLDLFDQGRARLGIVFVSLGYVTVCRADDVLVYAVALKAATLFGQCFRFQ